MSTGNEDWMDLAACKGMDPDLFFPERGESGRKDHPARLTCKGCPVKAECLQYALEHRELHGIWGGTSEKQRRKMRSEVRNKCGTHYGWLLHQKRAEPCCEACRKARNSAIAPARKQRYYTLRAEGRCWRCANGQHLKCAGGGCSCACGQQQTA